MKTTNHVLPYLVHEYIDYLFTFFINVYLPTYNIRFIYLHYFMYTYFEPTLADIYGTALNSLYTVKSFRLKQNFSFLYITIWVYLI